MKWLFPFVLLVGMFLSFTNVSSAHNKGSGVQYEPKTKVTLSDIVIAFHADFLHVDALEIPEMPQVSDCTLFAVQCDGVVPAPMEVINGPPITATVTDTLFNRRC